MVHYQPEKIQRVILKISGEFLAGKRGVGFDNEILERLAEELIELKKLGISVGVVIGGGNLYRGAKGEAEGVDRVTGDNIGMLATIQNCLVVSDYIRRMNYQAEVFSALQCEKVCRFYIPKEVELSLRKGRIVFLGAGTGNPFFTTDTAAVLRAVELKADMVLKGTKVDGVYSSDPMVEKEAKFHSEISYDEVLINRLNVMDMTAFSLARDFNIPIKVFNITKKGNIKSAILKKDEGTYIY
jgi:uridylate kinase